MLMCCVCVFSFYRESPDMILGDKPLISDVVLSQQGYISNDSKTAFDDSLEPLLMTSLQ
jgi:hypothetical protein